MLLRSVVLVLSMFALVVCQATSMHAQEVSPLFSCETDRPGKYILILGTSQGPDAPWKDVQYRFGAEGNPELVYPEDPTVGAQSIFFSHFHRRDGTYHVSLRFVHRGFTYRVYSNAIGPRGDGSAGVTVTDRSGRLRSRIACSERPYMFAGYLQRTLTCDMKNPYGKAACQDKPYRLRRR